VGCGGVGEFPVREGSAFQTRRASVRQLFLLCKRCDCCTPGDFSVSCFARQLADQDPAASCTCWCLPLPWQAAYTGTSYMSIRCPWDGGMCTGTVGPCRCTRKDKVQAYLQSNQYHVDLIGELCSTTAPM
jgi:hypothetical protein